MNAFSAGKGHVNMIHDVITTSNLFPYTAKFMFDSVKVPIAPN